jgi:hypothetical protein
VPKADEGGLRIQTFLTRFRVVAELGGDEIETWTTQLCERADVDIYAWR